MSDEPQAKKSLGQHWLHDTAALEDIVEAAELSKQDVVLEIGPGTGLLTKLLVAKAKKVVAVEFDMELAEQLSERIPATNLEIHHKDILRFDLNDLPGGYKVVANIPYYLTSNLLRVLCEADNPPSLIVLLVQKDVARRVAATPGDMSLLSVSVQFYCQVELGREVLAKSFVPPPKVDSQVLVLRHCGQRFQDVDSKQFFQIVKAGFSERRKKMRSSLAGGLRLSKPEADQLLTKAGIDSNRRAQELSLEEWRKLYKAYTI